MLYRDAASSLREKELVAMLERQDIIASGAPYKIASIDLNGDGVSEWIVRTESGACEAAAACPFIVAGISEGSPIILSRLGARNIGISGEKTYGVRKLLVYNDKSNDFKPGVFVWNPVKSAFEPE